MKITKENLYYKDYEWTVIDGDDPKVTGAPDSTLLNRKEGYEILYFINKFLERYKLKKVSLATKIEKMIREELPDDIRSQKKIEAWVETHWNKSDY